MAIRTRTSEGYQQVELTSELLHGQTGGRAQQVISTVPCTKHLPFFLSILLADVFLFASILLFAIYAAQYADGFSLQQQPEAPFRQWNLHALVMLIAFVYLNGQAMTAYKSNYLVKHKSLNMLYHFILHLATVGATLAGLYLTYQAQEASQQAAGRSAPVAHFYSVHSWTGIITIILFTCQFLFGFVSFFVTLCCRKLTARMRAKALPIHRTFAMIVLCGSVATVISGLSQLARFELPPQAAANASGSSSTTNKLDYRDFGLATVLVNLVGVSVLAATILIVFITFTFKRRQAYDLPVLFKIILLVAQFVEILLILIVAEFILQLVTPHVNKVMSGQYLGNTTFTHIINNATQSIGNFVSTATQHLANGVNNLTGASANSTSNATLAPSVGNDSAASTTAANILLGSSSTTAAGS